MARATSRMARPGAHPLDPLSEAEVATACEVLKTEKRLGPDTRFIHVQLDEPSKDDILRRKAGEEPRRRASSVLFDCRTGATHIAVVDLAAKAIDSWTEHPTRAHP